MKAGRTLFARAASIAAERAISTLGAALPVREPRIRILCYHRVCAPPDGRPLGKWNVRPERFDAQMRFLRAEGVDVISLSEAAERVRRGGIGPRSAVAISFDDGFRNQHGVAFPILRAHGLVASFYVPTSYVGSEAPFPWLDGPALRARGGPDPVVDLPMSWPEVHELVAAGMEVGSHSDAHPHFERLGAAECDHEVATSVAVLRERGIPVSTFVASFCVVGVPAGRLREALARHGLRGGVLGRYGAVTPEADPLDLPRITVFEDDDLDTFAAKVRGGWDRLAPLHHGYHHVKQRIASMRAR